MSADTYKGDSPSKKFARILHWLHMSELFKNTQGAHLYLASREMADYRVARRLELQTVGAEINAEAYATAKTNYPEAELFFGDVADCARSVENRPISSALLDFCAPLSSEMLIATTAVAARIPPGGVIAVNFLRGREQDTSIGPSGANRHMRRRLASIEAKTRISADARAMFDAVDSKSMRGVVTASGVNTRAARVCALIEAFNSRGIYVAPPKEIWAYQSATGTSKGVPMMYARFERMSPRQYMVWAVTPRSPVLPRLLTIRKNDDDVRAAAITAPGDSHAAADMLNLDAGTVAAWRAHATRAARRNEALAAHADTLGEAKHG